jgi:hypothetical protein
MQADVFVTGAADTPHDIPGITSYVPVLSEMVTGNVHPSCIVSLAVMVGMAVNAADGSVN